MGTSMEIAKEYLPESVEGRWLAAWEESDLFRGHPDSGKPPFCMVIPPPNVTGNLHIGHVLVYTLHDIVARWRRMQGYDVLWLPGTDHAGIATQMVVERELAKSGTSRHDLGREAFEDRVWEWKRTYGNRITDALRNLGASCDWSRERFTLDEGLSRAVRTVFVRLYEEGLIYRDRFIVNYCPRCHTAISDLETVHEPVQGRLYTVLYPYAEGSEGGIQVATTRPETMLGDVAVAVHPDDDRYAALVGREVVLPLAGRNIPIIADDFVQREFGTGAVKITPGHDPNDFAAGRRHGLPEVLALDTSGRMTEEAGEFAGMDRFEARERVLERLKEQGLLVGEKAHDHAVGHCQRCKTMIEPLVSTQWFVRIAGLAEEAIRAVEERRTEFVPDSWSKTYFEWMRNIHDWCISRQLWWGHRIPAWYCDACNETVVAVEDPTACTTCGGALRREEDVLDTWFSSALWPFSTLGWPDQTADLAHYYPTQLLITGFDIIFFWVARMIMMGVKFMDDVPFHRVYIHGLVRDARGQKMSKSKGNTVDPQEVQDRYGTDAVRFTMAILAAPGNDIPLAPERMEGYRAFANKLWNASRFVLMRLGDEPVASSGEAGELSLVDRWILSKSNRLVAEVTRALDDYRFDRAADALYHFVWHSFCDWYIEFVKPDLAGGAGGGDGRRAAVSRAVLLEVLDTVLRLLHPFMPFITEELWEKLPGSEGLLASASWSESDGTAFDETAESDVTTLQDLVIKVRNLRAESHIDPGRQIRILVHPMTDAEASLVREQVDRIAPLVRASAVEIVEEFPAGLVAARGVAGGFEVAIPLEGLLDLDAERTRLDRDLAKVSRELEARNRKLHNTSFLQKAPPEVVEKERILHAELAEKKERIERTLATLRGEVSP
jgi:valyl-tRNA synthetase